MESQIKSFVAKIMESLASIKYSKKITISKLNEFLDVHKAYDPILSIVKSLRVEYQKLLKQSLLSKSDIKGFTINYMDMVIKLSEVDLIDYSTCLYIIEDVFETFPINELETIFDLFEKNLRTKNSSQFQNRENLIILKISNNILKRLSTSVDTKFRGKVQMAIASVFPLNDKSGVNQKGLYNTRNQNYQIETNPLTRKDSNTFINSNFYKQFWIVHKHLCNPFLVILIKILTCRFSIPMRAM